MAQKTLWFTRMSWEKSELDVSLSWILYNIIPLSRQVTAIIIIHIFSETEQLCAPLTQVTHWGPEHHHRWPVLCLSPGRRPPRVCICVLWLRWWWRWRCRCRRDYCWLKKSLHQDSQPPGRRAPGRRSPLCNTSCSTGKQEQNDHTRVSASI